jgi:phage-related protein
MSIDQDIRALAPGNLVELFELDATAIGGSVVRFHNGSNGLRSNVVWQGNTYSAFPIEATGFEFNGRGQLPRPKVKIANVTGLVGVLTRDYGDLLGAKLTRRRTLAKYLDAVNFPGQRNLFLNTDSFSNAYWGKTGASPGAGAALTQRGTPTQRITEDTSSTGHLVSKTVAFTTGAQYTLSLCCAPFSGSVKRFMTLLLPTAAFGANQIVTFDSVTGSAQVTSGAPAFVVTKLSPSGYRLSITATATATASAALQFRLSTVATAAAQTYAGTGTSGLDVWDPQLEVGAVATEYQPIGAAFSANPTADPAAALPDDVFFVDRKASENKVFIEFELAAAFDVAGVQLPRRAVTQNVCTWKYRTNNTASGCSYTGTAYFDANDAPVGSAGLDVCGKRLSSCKARHGTAPLPFGGFPGVGLTR